MSSKNIFRGLFVAATLVAAGYCLQAPRATAGFPFKCGFLDQTGCSVCCPVCDHVCKLDAEQVEAEIPCFEVESKVICIPRVVFPWQKKKCSDCDSCDGRGCTNCVHNGARVRRVCVLKTDKIKCPKCEYSWSPEKKGIGCESGCAGSCDGGCDATLPSASPLTMRSEPSQTAGPGFALAPTLQLGQANYGIGK